MVKNQCVNFKFAKIFKKFTQKKIFVSHFATNLHIFYKNFACKIFCIFFAKNVQNFLQNKKRSKDCQSLILQHLLENNINQKMGTTFCTSDHVKRP